MTRFDQQEAQQIDPSNFDPDQELRDYAEVGRSLPVFCTSARAYQLLAKDEEVGGFGDMSDTEIPQLKAHTRKLTETTRIKSCRSFLTDLVQMLNSLYLWSSKQDVGLYLTNEEKQAEMVYVREKVNELEKVRYIPFIKIGIQANNNSVFSWRMRSFPTSLKLS